MIRHLQYQLAQSLVDDRLRAADQRRRAYERDEHRPSDATAARRSREPDRIQAVAFDDGR